ncbi:DUF3108 domain-containing protein [Atopomonas hussainii]|uniref:DUF3108 domain-containing protein n=1 Tax=Atopomonas hussainii TaxID=1429083 RepID=UPI0008FFED90|nr:DUF3108 domain-containing protein [Atopomonas hussainii]
MRLLLISLLTALPLLASASELLPFTASYTADWKQLPVSGSAERSLVKLESGQWEYQFRASMLVAELTERSVFHLNGQQIQPDQYRFKRGGLGKSKEISHDFDWANKQVTGSDRGEAVKLTLKSGLQDKSSYQLALRNDVADGKKSMSYQVVDGDEIDVYDFRVLGEEKVRTKAGLLDAIKVERVRDPTKSGRTTVLWFAKDWSYLLVRLHQKEEDGKEYQIMLKEAEVDGKPVKGAKDS